ncbi:MAG: PKD domain-containing protein, partial [Thermoplasmata archaeon]|nr:PKD domain-containing protein [Thermoplasmata archaeon]
WTASIQVIATAGPYGVVPDDQCRSAGSSAAERVGSNVVSGVLLDGSSGSSEFVSFPLTMITVSNPARLTVGLTIVPVAPLVNQTTFFQANIVGGVTPYSYDWSFGDGTTSTWAAPQHVYARPGSYTASVTIRDLSGQSAQASFALPVGTIPLVTGVSVVPSVTTVGQPVQLGGFATGGFSTYTFVWSGLPTGCFTQNSSTLSCLPASSGAFTIAMTVSDVAGDHETSRVSLMVNPPIESTIVQYFSSTCAPGGVVPLTVAANITGGTPSYQLFWNFGDGGTASGTFPVSHTYGRPGEYVVHLQITDAAGATSNQSVTVQAVSSSACPGSSLSHSSPPPSMVGFLLVGLAVVGIGAAAIIFLARRGRSI